MLLQTTAQPIAQIAGVYGYTCPSRFALAFRQRYGVSPSSLRATLPPARGDRHVKTQEA
jgi:AraC-like DNA-binding protein